jgi:uncharacterized OB-fold protein
MKGTPQVYTVAYITLNDGPTMMMNIVDCDLDRVAIGDRVKATFRRLRTARATCSSDRPDRSPRAHVRFPR